jgi:hypothetical protein
MLNLQKIYLIRRNLCASFRLRSSERLPLLVTPPTAQQRPEPVSQGRKFQRVYFVANLLKFQGVENTGY